MKIKSGIMLLVFAATSTTYSMANIGTTNTKMDPHNESVVVSDAERAIANEKAIWGAEKKKDKNAFENLLADNYAEITVDDGYIDRETVLRGFDRNGLQDYSLGPIKATIVNQGVILLTYEYHVKEMHEKMHEGNFVGSSIWAARAGKWVNVFFQETPKP
jgi:hypothetical protein